MEIVDRMRKLLPRRQDRVEERRFKIVVLLVIGAVLAMLLVALVTFGVTIKGPEQVLVPDAVGGEGHRTDLVTAMVKLQEKGLYARVPLLSGELHLQAGPRAPPGRGARRRQGCAGLQRL